MNDASALKTLYKYCVVNIKKIICNRFGYDLATDETAHNIFTDKILLKKLPYIISPWSWLKTITNNYMATQLISIKNDRLLLQKLSQKIEHDVENFHCEELQNALSKLTEDDRKIVVMHYLYEYSLKEISEILGFSYTNVRAKSSRALKIIEKTCHIMRFTSVFIYRKYLRGTTNEKKVNFNLSVFGNSSVFVQRRCRGFRARQYRAVRQGVQRNA